MDHSYYYAYIGTNSVRGSKGIYTLRIPAESGIPEVVHTMQEYNTGSVDLSKDQRHLYIASEGMTFRGKAESGVVGYAIGTDGALTELGTEWSYGQRACCVGVDEALKMVYACNFYKGTFAAIPLDAKGAPQPAKWVIDAPDIPNARKALHCVQPIGSEHVGVISLTEKALVVYESQTGRRVTAYQFPQKYFCRYFVTHGDYIYALMQQPGDVFVFRNNLKDQGTLEFLQKISTQPPEYEGAFGCSTIRVTPNGQLLIVAARRSNAFTIYRILEDGTLELSDILEPPGSWPRDFHISRDGKFMVAAMQKSDEVHVHRVDYERGTLLFTEGCHVSVPSPAAVAVSGRY